VRRGGERKEAARYRNDQEPGSDRQVVVIQIAPIELCFFLSRIPKRILRLEPPDENLGSDSCKRETYEFVRPRGEIIRGVHIRDDTQMDI